MTNTPKLTLIGLALDDANPAEHAPLLTDLPAPVRNIWHVISHPHHAHYISRVPAARPGLRRLTRLHQAHEDSQGEERCR
ncbi:hypothetical protein ACFCWV_39995 [Streptomyces sp. NPDC056341]|uniref:hypothetical protein n=1 Tax=Streptomyces sp. NPDC056341 TaxID=3345788 RepID=UPI0035D8D286